MNFNPRTRTGCDPHPLSYPHFGHLFQSTHPHGVRPDWMARDMFIYEFQSTHPHGVRLSLEDSLPPDHRISIHAPARGATLLDSYPFHRVLYFNPRTRTGCDDPTTSRISQYFNFNPRTRTGCDTSRPRLLLQPLLFQSTHPHGVRL